MGKTALVAKTLKQFDKFDNCRTVYLNLHFADSTDFSNLNKFLRLVSMGVVRFEGGNRVVPRCNLYREYFRDWAQPTLRDRMTNAPYWSQQISPANYQVGGSLPLDAPSYVTRPADEELYLLLRSGEFCYVLNSRQMGKSSLRVRLRQRLQAEGIICADIDLTLIGTQQISPQQWYGSLISSLANWESQDYPEHLKTIRDRLLRNGKNTRRLLGLYEQILEQGAIAANASPEEMELRLSGLVVKQENKLMVHNPIYTRVFDRDWSSRTLADLPPYKESAKLLDLFSSIDDFERGIRLDRSNSDEEIIFDMQAFTTESVGINKFLRVLYGRVEFEYQVIFSEAIRPNIYFYMILMQVTPRDGVGLIEVGTNIQDHPQNPSSPYRKRFDVPIGNYGSGQWHRAGISFDFRKTPTAFYSIFAPRINEGCNSPAPAHLLTTKIRMFSFE